jgi:hypothetical protein
MADDLDVIRKTLPKVSNEKLMKSIDSAIVTLEELAIAIGDETPDSAMTVKALNAICMIMGEVNVRLQTLQESRDLFLSRLQ